MAEPSQNNINLYKHYLEIAPKKTRQAKVLLKMFPSLGEEEVQEPRNQTEETEEVNKNVQEST